MSSLLNRRFLSLALVLLFFIKSGRTEETETEAIEPTVENDINSSQCVTNLEAGSLPQSPIDLLHLYLHKLRNSSNEICLQPQPNWHLRIFRGMNISVFNFKLHKEKADLIAFFIPKIHKAQTKNPAVKDEIRKGLESLRKDPHVDGARYVTSSANHRKGLYTVYDNTVTLGEIELEEKHLLTTTPWFFNALSVLSQQATIDTNKFDVLHNIDSANSAKPLAPHVKGYWTWPYLQCGQIDEQGHMGQPKLLISYSATFQTDGSESGLLSFDINLSKFPINQCEATSDVENDKAHPMSHFHGTHKCDRETTDCRFRPEEVGWMKGNYFCECKGSHYAANKSWHNKIPGLFLESKWCKLAEHETEEENTSFQLASCSPCLDGCPNCEDGESCMAEVNYIFRMTLLCISILCSVGSLGLIVGVYHCRKHQIFAVSSPIFLCICLFGCCVMYTEILVLFPTLNLETCIAVKWTRHLGFCITYTALYMKLCRVYLTFRVKSAHKIKLTEKHLLHWMSPIMVIMLLYLFAWTISAPPNYQIMFTDSGKRQHQCVYNWWDHVLSVGEIIFLAYGVFICWRIRENHDAQYISYSIYNIALVNVIMVTLHLLIVPQAGPDVKYLLAFVRVQMSTTITIALVLGSKVYRAYRGDYPTPKEIANSANGFGGDVLGLEEENEQLKEELQKVAYQMEKLKSYAMAKNNRHISNSSTSVPDKKETLTSL